MALTKSVSLLLSIIIISALLQNTIIPTYENNNCGCYQEDEKPIATWKWNRYFNYTEIVDFLRTLKENYSDLVELFSIGKSYENRSIWALRLTNRDYDESVNKTTVILIGGHHGREYISIMVPLYVAYQLLANYNVDENVTRLLDYMEIYIIPVLNPDGYMEALYHNPWHRKNTRPIDEDGDGLYDEDCPEDINGDGIIGLIYNNETGMWEVEGFDNDNDSKINEDWVGGVDLNRNYNFSWGYEWGASSNPSDPTYHGPYPFSEPETQAFRDFIIHEIIEKEKNVTFAISYHSGIEAILYPWGYTGQTPPDNDTFISLGKIIERYTGYPLIQANQLYPVSGEWGDWLYGLFGIISFTVEVFVNYTEKAKLYTEVEKYINGTPYIDINITAYFNPIGSLISKIGRKNYLAVKNLALLFVPKIEEILENKSVIVIFGYPIPISVLVDFTLPFISAILFATIVFIILKKRIERRY
ncbi:MAG: M14 family metallopeptidase [Candidatus Asgardarchaeum sp.]